MTISHPKTLLSERGLTAKHHFGQNFLSDPSLCAKIAKAAAPEGTSTIVEIGAGLGALTSQLLERAPHVIAIERDRDLVPHLNTFFAEPIEQGRLKVIEADAKTFDYVKETSGFPTPLRLCGNLPYQLTGPLLRRTIEIAPYLSGASFLVQLEVADRLVAKPDSEQYGALTIFLQAQFRAERAFVIKRGAFYPQPNVDSAVVVLIPLATPVTEETPTFRELVKCAFLQRRKKLRNAWSSVAENKEQLEMAAERTSIDLNLRGEVLSVEQFAQMAVELTFLKNASHQTP
jgi:16S rRNA (adenine1518-N6/adenine1519-N6)-dimethyltransferase